MLALPIQRFAPLSTQLVAVAAGRGLQRHRVGAVLGFGQGERPDLVQRAIAGSQRCFCSSLPSSAIEPMASPDWTPMNVFTLPSPRDISSVTIPAASRLSPGHS